MTTHRQDRISWQDSYMLSAITASWRSPDPNTQVGAAIVDPKQKTVVSTGYNGWPRGISNDSFSWDRDKKDPLDNKYAYVVHAEKNAIVNAKRSVAGCILYVTMFPCNNCTSDLIQAGIVGVVYLTNPYKDVWFTKASVRMLDHLDIPYQQHEWISPVTPQYLDSLSVEIRSKLSM